MLFLLQLVRASVGTSFSKSLAANTFNVNLFRGFCDSLCRGFVRTAVGAMSPSDSQLSLPVTFVCRTCSCWITAHTLLLLYAGAVSAAGALHGSDALLTLNATSVSPAASSIHPKRTQQPSAHPFTPDPVSSKVDRDEPHGRRHQRQPVQIWGW